MCAFLEYFHGWMWVVVPVEKTYMGGCTFLEYIYWWVGVCDCLKHIYEWVYLFRRLLWVGVTVYSILWVVVGGCDWVWVDVTGCGWVGKMVKPEKLR